MGDEGNGGTGERSLLRTNLFVPAPAKLLYWGWIWVEFVQVHVRTNVSDPFPEKIVRERLDGAIRLLRGESA